jgi:hypothetical protein
MSAEPNTMQVPPPKDWQDFERRLRDLFEAHWGAPATMHGRTGQPQHGVDTYGQPNAGDAYHGVQCKLHDANTGSEVTETDLNAEIKKAAEFEPRIAHFILATTGPRDAKIQAVVRRLNERKTKPFTVQVMFWDDILTLYGQHRDVFARHYPFVPPGPDRLHQLRPLNEDETMFSPQAITALVDLVTGGSGTTTLGPRWGVYRTASQLENFFGNCNLDLKIGSRSRVSAVRDLLTSINREEDAFAVLKPVFEAAVDPASYGSDVQRHAEARDHLNQALSTNGFQLVRHRGTYHLTASDAESAAGGVSEVTRRNILDYLRVTATPMAGRLHEVEFLSRLYALDRLPSTDHRFKNAAEDIWQHRINNQDWGDYWVFSDNRFDLMHCSTEEFLRFLCELLHPVVRDADAVPPLIHAFNESLRADGFKLVETRRISGRPVYTCQQSTAGNAVLPSQQRENGDAASASPPVAPDVFVSYSHKDSAWVRGTLVPRLRGWGLNVSIDHETFRPGRSLVSEIQFGIGAARHVLFVVTGAFSRSEWTRRELQEALGQDPALLRSKCIPLVLESSPVPDELRHVVWCDLSADREDELQWRKLRGTLTAQAETN